MRKYLTNKISGLLLFFFGIALFVSQSIDWANGGDGQGYTLYSVYLAVLNMRIWAFLGSFLRTAPLSTVLIVTGLLLFFAGYFSERFSRNFVA